MQPTTPCLWKRQEHKQTSNLCSGLGQATLAVTLQKEITLVLFPHWADKRWHACFQKCVLSFTLLLFSPENCLRTRRCLGISFSPRVPNLFSFFTNPAPPRDQDSKAKDAKRKINIFHIDFLILGRFMNFPSVLQKLAFLTRGGAILNCYFIASKAPKTSWAVSSFTFHIKCKICLKWANTCFNLIHLLTEVLKRQLNHYIKFSDL